MKTEAQEKLDALYTDRDSLSGRQQTRLDYQLATKDYKDVGNASSRKFYGEYNTDPQRNVKYDDELNGLNRLEDGYSLDNLRAENQSIGGRFARGAGKMATTAVTTFLDNTFGFIYGIGAQAAGGSFIDNSFSRAMHSIDEWSQDWGQIYDRYEDKDKNLFQQMFTSKFWADDILANAGFTIGSIGAAIVTGGGGLLRSLPKMLLKKGMSRAMAQNVTMLAGATISAFGEGAIEGYNNSEDWVKTRSEDALRKRNEKIRKIQNDASLTSEEKDRMIENIIDEADWNIGMTYQKKIDMANADMLMNIPILVASNVVQIGKALGGVDTKIVKPKIKYTKDFKNKVKALEKEILDTKKNKSILNPKRYMLSKSEKDLVKKKAFENLDIDTYRQGYDALDYIKAFVKNPISEGSEEMLQSIVSAASGIHFGSQIDSYLGGDDKLNYSWMQSLWKGFSDNIQSEDSWKEFVVGAFMGFGGLIKPKFKNGKFSGFEPVGGVWEDVKETNEKKTRAKELCDYMNDRLKDNKFQESIRTAFRGRNYDEMLNGWLREDEGTSEYNKQREPSEMEKQDIEQMNTLQSLQYMLSMGKENDLQYIINSAYDTSDENVQNYINQADSFIDNKEAKKYAERIKLELEAKAIEYLKGKEEADREEGKDTDNKEYYHEGDSEYDDSNNDLVNKYLEENYKDVIEQANNILQMEDKIKTNIFKDADGNFKDEFMSEDGDPENLDKIKKYMEDRKVEMYNMIKDIKKSRNEVNEMITGMEDQFDYEAQHELTWLKSVINNTDSRFLGVKDKYHSKIASVAARTNNLFGVKIDEHNAMKSELDDMISKIDDNNAKIEDLENQKKELKKKLSEDKVNLDEKYKNDIKNKHDEIESMEDDITKIEEEISSNEKEIEEYNKKAEEELEKIKKELEESRNEELSEQYKTKIKERKTSAEKYKEHIEKLKNGIEKLKQKRQAIEAKISQNKKDIDDINKKYKSDSDNLYNSLHEAIEKLEQVKKNIVSELEKLAEKYKKLKKVLEGKTGYSIKKLNKEQGNIRKEIENIKPKIEELKSKIDKLNEVISSIRETLKQQEGSRDELAKGWNNFVSYISDNSNVLHTIFQDSEIDDEFKYGLLEAIADTNYLNKRKLQFNKRLTAYIHNPELINGRRKEYFDQQRIIEDEQEAQWMAEELTKAIESTEGNDMYEILKDYYNKYVGESKRKKKLYNKSLSNIMKSKEISDDVKEEIRKADEKLTKWIIHEKVLNSIASNELVIAYVKNETEKYNKSREKEEDHINYETMFLYIIDKFGTPFEEDDNYYVKRHEFIEDCLDKIENGETPDVESEDDLNMLTNIGIMRPLYESIYDMYNTAFNVEVKKSEDKKDVSDTHDTETISSEDVDYAELLKKITDDMLDDSIDIRDYGEEAIKFFNFNKDERLDYINNMEEGVKKLFFVKLMGCIAGEIVYDSKHTSSADDSSKKAESASEKKKAEDTKPSVISDTTLSSGDDISSASKEELVEMSKKITNSDDRIKIYQRLVELNEEEEIPEQDKNENSPSPESLTIDKDNEWNGLANTQYKVNTETSGENKYITIEERPETHINGTLENFLYTHRVYSMIDQGSNQFLSDNKDKPVYFIQRPEPFKDSTGKEYNPILLAIKDDNGKFVIIGSVRAFGGSTGYKNAKDRYKKLVESFNGISTQKIDIYDSSSIRSSSSQEDYKVLEQTTKIKSIFTGRIQGTNGEFIEASDAFKNSIGIEYSDIRLQKNGNIEGISYPRDSRYDGLVNVVVTMSNGVKYPMQIITKNAPEAIEYMSELNDSDSLKKYYDELIENVKILIDESSTFEQKLAAKIGLMDFIAFGNKSDYNLYINEKTGKVYLNDNSKKTDNLEEITGSSNPIDILKTLGSGTQIKIKESLDTENILKLCLSQYKNFNPINASFTIETIDVDEKSNKPVSNETKEEVILLNNDDTSSNHPTEEMLEKARKNISIVEEIISMIENHEKTYEEILEDMNGDDEKIDIYIIIRSIYENQSIIDSDTSMSLTNKLVKQTFSTMYDMMNSQFIQDIKNEEKTVNDFVMENSEDKQPCK